MIRRMIENAIREKLFGGKVIIISGPRQVGKTTLLKKIQEEAGIKSLWLNCDEPDIRSFLEEATSTELKKFTGDHKMIFIDEAQRVKNIGITLKLFVDNFPDIQVIATGSSALELANTINEPLTGRKWEFQLYPFSTGELVLHTSETEESRLLEQRLIYGLYPEIVNHPSRAAETIAVLADSYLYKDLLSLAAVRKPALLDRILTALALQLGQEVSFNELGQITGADSKTVEQYIQLLEKSYILFQLPAFSRNLRNEIKKGRKIYFCDNGIRNAIIKNFNPLALRQDTGALWENWLVSERKKFNAYSGKTVNSYFWRTHAQQEIDYVEEGGGRIAAIEFKWNEQHKAKLPEAFSKAYPDTQFTTINRKNYMPFLTEG